MALPSKEDINANNIKYVSDDEPVISCFDDMVDPNTREYRHHFYTLENVLDEISLEVLYHFKGHEDCAFESRIGCSVGRLSALALYQPEIATTAYQSLLSMVRVSVQYDYVRLGLS